MKKNKQYFMNLATFKTIAVGILYLLMPIAANWYDSKMPDGWRGYTAFGAGIMILGNIILLVRVWALALDGDYREDYLNSLKEK